MDIKIHRCADEIGGNCIEISTKTTRVLFDFGMPLVEKDGSPFDYFKYKNLPIKELIKKKILPDVKGFYPNSRKLIDAVVVSHPHMDYFGFLSYLNKKKISICSY